ncbi:hypothetical protein ILUMI_26324 [Ignelater luminosus]|uniref:Uncharacterized protein n=1 Tax=Ignelater luminosus TaxID=2038154 RepID=A0A8K0C8Q1_IGNLU|nr:hypothetical protein ILUMI_26324 [Ignelater luminosus]
MRNSGELLDTDCLEEVENILALVEDDAMTSSRRIATQLGIPQTRVINTAHEKGLYPYYLQRVQHLQPEDYVRRKQHLDERFLGRWIGRGGPTSRPPRSSDLTPLDYCL